MKKPDDQDEMGALRKRLAHLKQALKDAEAERVLNAAFLDLACRELGESTSDFKKQCIAKPIPEQKRGRS